MFRVLAKLVLVASLWGTGFAMAQAEPSMNQIYATAQAGKLDAAQLMVQQVLIAHPRSAKAFFVQAELYARQGKLANALDTSRYEPLAENTDLGGNNFGISDTAWDDDAGGGAGGGDWDS